MSKNPKSIEMIKLIANALGELNNKAVYVGGASIPFYLPEIYWSQARPTEDVDIVMEVVGRAENWATDELLRSKGFKNDTSEGAPICRWVYQGLKVDLMTPNQNILGFANSWYKEEIEKTIEILISPITIRILSLPYFLATKIEAFKDRGYPDFMGSKDMEDIISLLEVSNEELFKKGYINTSESLRAYLKAEFLNLKKQSAFLDSIPGALFNRINTAESSQFVLKRIDQIIGNFYG